MGPKRDQIVNAVPREISEQVAQACAVIQHGLSKLQAIHLYGSALDGGLKPSSDIDLLVTVGVSPDENTRKRLLLDLLNVSAPPGRHKTLRALEVTVVSYGEVVPWRHPARRELQFGEWLREDLLSGRFEPPILDHDLAVLFTKIRQHSLSLMGAEAAVLFDPVPKRDFLEALSETLSLWVSPKDWAGDERNVLLTLARIWYSASTGQIAPKDVAATWLLERVPSEHQNILREAREAYLGHCQDRLSSRAEQVKAFIDFAKASIDRARLLEI